MWPKYSVHVHSLAAISIPYLVNFMVLNDVSLMSLSRSALACSLKVLCRGSVVHLWGLRRTDSLWDSLHEWKIKLLSKSLLLFSTRNQERSVLEGNVNFQQLLIFSSGICAHPTGTSVQGNTHAHSSDGFMQGNYLHTSYGCFSAGQDSCRSYRN